MLKPDQMETLPLAGLTADVIAALPAETALTDADGEVVGVVLTPDDYLGYRQLVYEWARNLPEARWSPNADGSLTSERERSDALPPVPPAAARLLDGSTASLVRAIEALGGAAERSRKDAEDPQRNRAA